MIALAEQINNKGKNLCSFFFEASFVGRNFCPFFFFFCFLLLKAVKGMVIAQTRFAIKKTVCRPAVKMREAFDFCKLKWNITSQNMHRL